MVKQYSSDFLVFMVLKSREKVVIVAYRTSFEWEPQSEIRFALCDIDDEDDDDDDHDVGNCYRTVLDGKSTIVCFNPGAREPFFNRGSRTNITCST